MSRPKLLLLDEPSLGLSPLLVKEIFAIIRRVNEEQGMSILLVEQNAHMALKTAHYGYVLEVGRIVMADSCERLAASQRHPGILSRRSRKTARAASGAGSEERLGVKKDLWLNYRFRLGKQDRRSGPASEAEPASGAEPGGGGNMQWRDPQC